MKAVKIKRQEAFDISSISKNENVIVPDVGIAAGRILNVQDSYGRLSGRNVISDRDDTFICKEENMCQAFFQSVSFDAKMQKCLSKCATFPSSIEAQLNALSIKGREGSPGTSAQDQSSSTFESSTYARSMSLPTSLKLVSAMKGGRAQNGASPKVELRVKWAPEVYDPPATSMSHTVNSHHQRPRAKKKDHHNKHKHNKGKSSRGSGSERKQTNRRNTSNILDPLDTKLQASGYRFVFDGYVKSNVEVPEYAGSSTSSQEAKCGSSFLREALANVHLSIGEAS